MRIFFSGNYKNDNGPANVNKNIIKNLREIDLIREERKLSKSIFEIVVKSYKSDVVIISGLSHLNFLTILISKLLNKKSIYIMHGFLKYENKINKIDSILNVGELYEKYILKKSSLVLCVSKTFKKLLLDRKIIPEKKLFYLNNGINWGLIESKKYINEKKDDIIITIGGGRIQKNNLIISKAIEKINKEFNMNYKLYVIGEDGEETELLKKISCVKYFGKLNHSKVLEYLSESILYVQNSSFESFGLAPIEALIMGNSILLSKNIGCRDIISELTSDETIRDTQDIDEISKKIMKILKNPNHKRLLNSINKKTTSTEEATKKLIQISEKILKGEKIDV